jgi:hypothetical protein
MSDNTLAIHNPSTSSALSPFANLDAFEAAQRMARCLCSSDLVPEAYRGEKIGNALIALEMAQRIGASPLAVMQSLHIIEGRPSWSSSFIIAALNACGRFSPLRFRVEELGPQTVVSERSWWDKRENKRQFKTESTELKRNAQFVAWAYDKATGEVLEGPPVSFETAVREGWWTKPGSKWQTMPDLMGRYRAAAFFGRLYAPDVLNGMHAAEEVEDAGTIDVTPVSVKSSAVDALNASIQSAPSSPQATEPSAPSEPSEPAQEVLPPPAPRTRRRASAPAPEVDAELLPTPTKTAPANEPAQEGANANEWD